MRCSLLPGRSLSGRCPGCSSNQRRTIFVVGINGSQGKLPRRAVYEHRSSFPVLHAKRFFGVPGVLAGARSWSPPIGANFPVCPGQPIFYVPRCRLGQFEVPAVRSGRAQGKEVLGDWLFRSAGSSGFLASALVPQRESCDFRTVGPLGHCRMAENCKSLAAPIWVGLLERRQSRSKPPSPNKAHVLGSGMGEEEN